MIPWLRLRSHRPRRTRLTVERLEDRLTPSGFVVTDTSDSLSDTGSLRHALVRANADTRANDVFTITFDPSLAGQTIALGSTLEVSNITSGLTVVFDGSAAPGLVIAGDAATFSVFTVDAHAQAAFTALMIAQGGTAGNGGAIFNRQGTVTVQGCLFDGNAASGGGAIANMRGTMTVQNSTFTSNSATVLGGAIENNLGTLTVQGCTLSGNAAGGNGGGIFNVGTLTVVNTTFAGNDASTGDGGGIENFIGTLTIANATFNANTASGDGGAIGNEGTVSLQCATVSGNTASGNGGGIENDGTLSLQNSIVAANSATGLGDDIDGSVTTDLGNNLLGTNVDTGTAAGDVFSDAPGLAPLAYYGGALPTMAVLPNSPAHNAGNAAAVALPATDENGGARTVLGALDIGAYQTQADPFLVTTTSDTDGLAGQLTLREAITLANFFAGAGIPANITFAPSLQGATITLMQGVLELSGVAPTGMATISITGRPGLTLDGGAASALLLVDAGVTASVSVLTLADSSGDSGGAIANNGTLAVTACALTNNAAGSDGGAIENTGTLTVTDCTFSGNSAGGNGGALGSIGTLAVTGCTFADNNAYGGDGGAIDNASELSVTGSSFTDNIAGGNGGALGGSGSWIVTGCTFAGNAASGGDGGAIDNNDSTATVNVAGCTFTNNTAVSNGGAIAASGPLTVANSALTGNGTSGDGGGIEAYGDLTITGSSVSGNNAGGSGGGIVANGNATVVSCGLTGNTAGYNGGGIANNGTATVLSSTIGGNTASGSGGGIENDGTLAVQNSTFGADSATDGGGINNNGDLTVQNSTISGNVVGDLGGGITNNNTLTLQNSIVSGNVDSGGIPDIVGGITADLGNNLLGATVYDPVNGVAAPPGDIVTDTPGVAPLGSYGGVLQTMPLLPNSKARNAGNARAAGLPTADEVGAPRTTAGRLDIGAYQMHTNPLVVTTLADPGGTLGQVSLREAVNLANAYAAGGNTATITFAPTLQGGAITLTQGALELSGFAPKAPTITINGGSRFTLSANGASGVLQIDSGVTAVVSGLAITGGNAATGGGILNNGTLTVNSCTLAGNAATAGDGGAIASAGVMTVSNCTLTGNTASGNGGAIASSGVTSVQFSTLSGNSASGNGGGIVSTFKLTLQNTILSGNTATVGGPDLAGLITSDLGTNLLGTAVYNRPAPRNDIITDTPGLARLGNYGGGLQTMALLPTSKAIGTGNPAAAHRPTTDERGFARTTAGRLDIGAFQTQVNPFLVTTAADPGRLPGLLALREAVNLADAYAAAGHAAGITFAAGLKGATVTLTQGPLDLNGSATITINGGRAVTVSGNGTSSVFVVDAGATAILTGMAIAHGNTGIQNNGTLAVQSCTLAGNTASGNGGGITNTGTLTLLNDTLSGNTASGNGGAIANTGLLTVQSCTISGNGASAGGGIANTGWLTLQNSIVAANTASAANPDILGTITVDAGNNLLGTAVRTSSSPASDLFTDTPGLAALGSYGGGLKTMALLPGSLALGAGVATGAPTTDERGTLRRRDSLGRPIVDIGAFESSGFTIGIAAGGALSARVGQAFALPLTVIVTARNPLEPVAGGVVRFIAQTGSKWQTATLSSAAATITGHKATVSATANAAVGAYTVTASSGAGSAVFLLKNM